ncbi:MAG: HDOD domain-containing protein [Deltaproteobacteria bacterium]|nr:HDOD domain-containing protein [Deltaproteobacteria bacterium]
MDVNFIKNIAAHISAVPPLPAAAQKLIQLTSFQDVDIREVSQVIAMDQAIASKLLQIVNSPFYGLRQKVNTIPQAITLMGLEAIKSLALSVSVIRSSAGKKRSGYLNQEDFWTHSLSTAILCKKIAGLIGNTDPEEAFIAGLMHDIGKLVFFEFTGDSYRLALEQASKAKASLNSFELEIFEINHALLGEELCHHWMIPEKISKAIASHHEAPLEKEDSAEQGLGNIVSVANQLAHILNLGSSGNHLISLNALSYLVKKNIGLDLLIKTIEAATKEINDSWKYFDFKETTDEIDEKQIGLCLENNLEKMMLSLILSAQHRPYEDFTHNPSKQFQIVIHDQTPSEEGLTELKGSGVKMLNFEEWKEKNIVSEMYPMNFLHQWLSEK